MAAQEQSLLNVQNNLANVMKNVESNIIKITQNAISNVQINVPSYLYSIILPNATFERDNNGGILSFKISEDYNIIEFTDRPFRKSNNITIQQFIDLFKTLGVNSFEEDPPNGVLVHDEEQRSYRIKLVENNQLELDIVKFHLDLLPGETHNLKTITGKMWFFVDEQEHQQP